MSDEQEVVGRLDLEVLDVALVVLEIGVRQVGIGLRIGERNKAAQTETGAGILVWKKNIIESSIILFLDLKLNKKTNGYVTFLQELVN